MSGLEILGLVFGGIGIIPVLKQGYKLVHKYQKRKRLALKDKDVISLTNEIQESASRIEAQYNTFHSLHGDGFAQGDGKARRQISTFVRFDC
jgi:hypothetical protein